MPYQCQNADLSTCGDPNSRFFVCHIVFTFLQISWHIFAHICGGWCPDLVKTDSIKLIENFNFTMCFETGRGLSDRFH